METEDKLVFVVEHGQGSRAVGKKGQNVIRLKNISGKDIQVIEYSDDPETFVRNVFHTYQVQSVTIEMRGSIVHATVKVDPKSKGKAIGKNGKNLRIAREMVSRHHNIQSISVA
jgi:N utilization substance protein A